MLNSTEDMVRKIENTLRYFELQKERVVLLWRPHPLLAATIESMRLNYWKNIMRS